MNRNITVKDSFFQVEGGVNAETASAIEAMAMAAKAQAEALAAIAKALEKAAEPGIGLKIGGE